jgi:site-specific recombinase XerD
VVGELRLTELTQLDAEATDSDEQGRWCFVTLIKLHRRPQQICIDTIPEEALDPVKHLLAVRSEVREKKKEMKKAMAETSFWIEENGEKMTCKQIRNSVIEVMRAAGINNPKPHQLKAAAITKLKKREAIEADIIQYARHVRGSLTCAKHYWDANNCRDGTRKLAAIKQVKGGVRV